MLIWSISLFSWLALSEAGGKLFLIFQQVILVDTFFCSECKECNTFHLKGTIESGDWLCINTWVITSPKTVINPLCHSVSGPVIVDQPGWALKYSGRLISISRPHLATLLPGQRGCCYTIYFLVGCPVVKTFIVPWHHPFFPLTIGNCFPKSIVF